jgi:hypothetical protein
MAMAGLRILLATQLAPPSAAPGLVHVGRATEEKLSRRFYAGGDLHATSLFRLFRRDFLTVVDENSSRNHPHGSGTDIFRAPVVHCLRKSLATLRIREGSRDFSDFVDGY